MRPQASLRFRIVRLDSIGVGWLLGTEQTLYAAGVTTWRLAASPGGPLRVWDTGQNPPQDVTRSALRAVREIEALDVWAMHLEDEAIDNDIDK